MSTPNSRVPRSVFVLDLMLCLLLAVVTGACSGSEPQSAEAHAAEIDCSALRQARDLSVEREVFLVAEQEARVIGGRRSIVSNVEYPELAKGTNLAARVFVETIITKDGCVARARALKVETEAGSLSEAFAQAAVNAVKDARFRPARQRGQRVEFQMTLEVPVEPED